MIVTPTSNLHVRKGPGLEHAIAGKVYPGDRLAVLDEDAAARLGKYGEWLNVRAPGGLVGWSAAWYLVPAALPVGDETATPANYPETGFEGAARALGFDHTPVFTCLPCETWKVGQVGGFGPNNYAYLVRHGSTYAYANGLHSGLDFGMLVGTPLVAMDWGVVVWTSRWKGDNPYGAGPYSVLVRHGNCVVLYGHAGKTILIERGDVVRPGDVLCHSGTAFNWAHLHLEVRRIDDAYIERLRRAAEFADGYPLATMNALFDHGRENLSQTEHWLNPALFFTTPLESYGFPLACHHHTDTDGDGYPDRLQWDAEDAPCEHGGPREHGLYAMQSIPPWKAMPNYWAGCREV